MLSLLWSGQEHSRRIFSSMNTMRMPEDMIENHHVQIGGGNSSSVATFLAIGGLVRCDLSKQGIDIPDSGH